jgi:5-methylcytosine-specific restriction endonuclease McrA
MPDREVKTIRDLIFFQYAKIIGKQAFGPNAKKEAYGFIRTSFRELRDNEKKWSDILRNDKHLVEGPKACIYCGATDNLQWEHIVPRSLLINERCPVCPRIQEIHNMVWACRSCNASKGDKGFYHFIRDSHPEAKKFSDLAPVLAEEKYLKTIYCCHLCKGTLDTVIEGITVLDLDLT